MTTEAQIESLMGIGPPPGSKMIDRWGKNNPQKDPQMSFAGKTVLVTGSNTSLGYWAALKFAALGVSKLILAVRTPAKGNEAKAKIIVATGCDAATIIVMQLDMSSFDSVKAFAKQLKKEVDTLNIAVLNAGIAPSKYIVNLTTGWESALQVNILSTALLAILLMPKLKTTTLKTGRLSQLTITGSIGHKYVEGKDLEISPGENLLKKISSPEFFDVRKNYMVIKLLDMYIMQGLIDNYSKNTEGKVDVAINIACPGYCTTDLGRDFPWYIILPTKIMQMYYARTAEEGSRSLVSATQLGKTGHGKFWTNDIFEPLGEFSTSDQGMKLQAQAWKEIRDVCLKELH